MTAWLIVAPLALASTPGAAAQDDIGNAAAALAQGRATLELRPRYNHIEEADRPLATEGGTARLVAGWRSAPWHGARVTVEAIHAGHFGAKRFNDDPANFATSPYPLLPDPEHTGINQAHLELALGDLRAILGRQRLRMDNQRWVSDNDFRQIPQLFDGATLVHDGIANARLTAGHYRRIRGTSGDTARARLTIAHGAWNPAPGHALAAYAYFHDQPETSHFTGFADNSYRVAGVRAEGVALRARRLEVAYVAEYARQRRYAGGDARIDARYVRLGAGVGDERWTLRYDRETKGSNGGQYGMQTPLADFYAFNGWTLHFFTTPRDGLVDRWVTGRWSAGPVTLYAEAHRFRSDFRDLDYGRELDVGVSLELAPSALLRLQHGHYEPGGGAASAEVRKTWLTLTCTY